MRTESSKRYQVFVSSTYLDLRVERQAVTSALLESDAFPAGMELFPATDDDAWTLIKRVIDESDYYLLVIAGKYGSVDSASGLSYTEMEYDYATSVGKPVMAFLHGDPGTLTRDASEVSQSAIDALDAFVKKVKSAKHVKYWTNSEGLAGAVALSFNKFVKLFPAVGWVRADEAGSPETLRLLTQAQERVRQLEANLDEARTTPPPGVEGLSQGSDTIELLVFVSARYRDKQNAYRSMTTWAQISISWDKIFGLLGLLMFDEASTTDLKKAFLDWMAQEYFSEFDEKSDQRLSEDGTGRKNDTRYSERNLHVDDEDFRTLLLQFKALGMVRNGIKKRSVNDAETYWSLTPFGETRLLEVRALKRGQSDLRPELLSS